MKEFISLREFLLLKDPFYKDNSRSVHRGDYLDYRKGWSMAEEAVMRYDIAKASWEMYGDEGPPFGSIVRTLQSGHGGGPGVEATLTGLFERDPRCFLLTRKEKDSFYKTEHEEHSLVERTQWWVHIKVKGTEDERKRDWYVV